MNLETVNGAARFSQEAVALRSRPAQQLRDKWQCRLLAETKGKEFAVVLAVIGNAYWEVMDVLMRVTFPGFVDVDLPIYHGTAAIASGGQVVCDMIVDGNALGPYLRRNVLVYDTQDALIKVFRDLADKLKFSAHERNEMFSALRRWVTLDRRVKPDGTRS